MPRVDIGDDVLAELAAPYFRRAAEAASRGEADRACAFRVIGSAFQLMPTWRTYKVPRGKYFGQLSSGDFGDAPDMAIFGQPGAVEVLSRHATRTRNLKRRARLADAAWEYGGLADMARVAIDTYEEFGSEMVNSDREHAPMYGAAAIARATVLARTIGDEPRLQRISNTLRSALDQLSPREEHVAVFVLVEAILESGVRGDGDELIAHADRTLAERYARLVSADADNFTFQRTVVKLRRRIASRNKASTEVMDRELAEAIAREADWKGRHYKNGALVEMHFLEEAAQRFEVLGDHDRAAQLRGRQRGAFPQAKLQLKEIEHTVRLEGPPFREWLTTMLAGSPEQRAQMWASILPALPVPTREEIDLMAGDERRELPHLAFASVTTLTPDGVTEVTPAEQAPGRRAQHFAFEYHGLKVALLVKLAQEDHKYGVTEAVPVLAATGHFDKTSRSLLERLARAHDAHDWVTVAYLAGPLLERLMRRLATDLGLETMRTDRSAPGAGTGRRDYVSIEDLLGRLPLAPDVRGYVRWVVSRPGLNLRNAVGHGILDVDHCHEVLGAHVLYAILALSFDDLTTVSTD